MAAAGSRPRIWACITSRLGRAETCEGGLGAFARDTSLCRFPHAPGLRLSCRFALSLQPAPVFDSALAKEFSGQKFEPSHSPAQQTGSFPCIGGHFTEP
jgi:hypothetical protein